MLNHFSKKMRSQCHKISTKTNLKTHKALLLFFYKKYLTRSFKGVLIFWTDCQSLIQFNDELINPTTHFFKIDEKI